MKIYLTEAEVIELSYDALDMIQPNPDKVHDIALRMDMVYDENLDMYEDIEEYSLRRLKASIKELQKCYPALLDSSLNTSELRSNVFNILGY